MKYILIVLLLGSGISVSSHANAEHNGIRFDMTADEIKAMGFRCDPPKKQDAWEILNCAHMSMVGEFFGFPTFDYEVDIGPSGKVDSIGAKIRNVRTLGEMLSLQNKVQRFFPIKDEKGTHSQQGMYTRDAWLDEQNEGIYLFYFAQTVITPAKFSVGFTSARRNAAISGD